MLVTAQATRADTIGEAQSPAVVAVRAAGLGVTIDGRRVLSGVDLELLRGTSLALLGANGAGKSTLLRVLAGLTTPSEGSLRLFGLEAARPGPALRARIGLVAHQPMLYRDLTVLENLEFFARLYGVKDARARAGELVAELGLIGREGDAVRALSRGLVQRVALARALVHRPELLLADEPFTGLDSASSAALEERLAALRAGGTTIITATHDVPQALRMAGRVVGLSAGRVALDVAARMTDEEAVRAALEARP